MVKMASTWRIARPLHSLCELVNPAMMFLRLRPVLQDEIMRCVDALQLSAKYSVA